MTGNEMRDPYENILIGNFLYSLGLTIGSRARGRELHAAVNLLQQTPLDGALADVHLRYPGVVRLIEFKRESNKSDKEADKRRVLEGELLANPALQPVSRAIHWYVESSSAPLEWTTKVCPYLDFERTDVSTVSLQAFVRSLADTAMNAEGAEFSDEMIQLYLMAVGSFSGKSSSSSGLLVCVGKDGELHYIALENIHEMRYELEVHKKHAQQMSLQIEMERSRETDELESVRQQSKGGPSRER